jgi:hypothetical protein
MSLEYVHLMRRQYVFGAPSLQARFRGLEGFITQRLKVN